MSFAKYSLYDSILNYLYYSSMLWHNLCFRAKKELFGIKIDGQSVQYWIAIHAMYMLADFLMCLLLKNNDFTPCLMEFFLIYIVITLNFPSNSSGFCSLRAHFVLYRLWGERYCHWESCLAKVIWLLNGRLQRNNHSREISGMRKQFASKKFLVFNFISQC